MKTIVATKSSCFFENCPVKGVQAAIRICSLSLWAWEDGESPRNDYEHIVSHWTPLEWDGHRRGGYNGQMDEYKGKSSQWRNRLTKHRSNRSSRGGRVVHTEKMDIPMLEYVTCEAFLSAFAEELQTETFTNTQIGTVIAMESQLTDWSRWTTVVEEGHEVPITRHVWKSIDGDMNSSRRRIGRAPLSGICRVDDFRPRYKRADATYGV